MESLLGYLVAIQLFTPIVITATAWFAKRWIQHGFENASLQLSSDLNRRNKEDEIRFSTTYPEQVRILAEMYGKIAIAVREVRDYVKLFQPANQKTREERERVVADAYNEASTFFEMNCVFVNSQTESTIRSILEIMFDSFIAFNFAHDQDGRVATPDLWREASEKMTKKLPPLKEQLVASIREVIHGR